jgi:drug/metabolite transporter (DMT)-like permease
MSPRGWAAFAAMSAIWGVPYLFIKIAVDDGVSPAFVSFARVTIAAVVLLAPAWRAGKLPALRGRWRWLAVLGVVEIVFPFPLIAAGEQRVSSSLAAIVIACVPLLVAVIALRVDPEERASGRRLVGLLIGLLGVVALVGIDVAGDGRELVGVLFLLVAATGYAIGPMVIKAKLAGLDPRASMGACLAISALALGPFAAASSGTAPSGQAWMAIVVLGLVCTALALVLFNVLIAEAGPGRATVITYVNPVVAVAVGVAFLDERPGPGAIVGLLLILGGSWLSTDGRLPRRRRPAIAA